MRRNRIILIVTLFFILFFLKNYFISYFGPKKELTESEMESKMFIKTLSGVRMPRIIYGTAWKKERTVELVEKAIKLGFRGIDTACQPKHYREDLVGVAVKNMIDKNIISRDEIFLQTKYTPIGGQDPNNVPYDVTSPLEEQVRQSFNKSLQNLQTQTIDSLVLHSPLGSHEETMQVWRVFEELHSSGKVKQLGISNIYELTELKKIWNDANVKPSVVQNRFYDTTNYDKELRYFCLKNGIWYQSFWTLTANPNLLSSKTIVKISERLQKTPAQILFRYLMRNGVAPLTGAKNEEHMKEDLEVGNLTFDITDEDTNEIDKLL